jgi:hypothetical protein
MPPTRPTEKSFGIVFSILFLIIAIYPLTSNHPIHVWSLVLSTLFLILAYIAPKSLTIPNKLWFKFGLLLGSIVAPIVMALVFFTSVVPIGLIMRFIGKDLLKQKIDKNCKTYWQTKEPSASTMQDQF